MGFRDLLQFCCYVAGWIEKCQQRISSNCSIKYWENVVSILYWIGFIIKGSAASGSSLAREILSSAPGSKLFTKKATLQFSNFCNWIILFIFQIYQITINSTSWLQTQKTLRSWRIALILKDCRFILKNQNHQSPPSQTKF